MRVAFTTAGPIEFASSRMRAFWVAPHMPDATTQTYADMLRTLRIPNADAYIFQKRIHSIGAQELIEKGKQVWWDVCDPSWWWEPKVCREIGDTVTGIVASNQGLADDWVNFYGDGKPIHVIPDRLQMSHFDTLRLHHDTSPVRFIWFGMSCNRVAIASAWHNLVILNSSGFPVTLTIMDDRPEESYVWELGTEFPIAYMKWSLGREVDILASHDVALLPPYPGPWGEVKSDNKKLTAWACGLPVTDGSDIDDLYALVTDTKERAARAASKRRWVEQFASVKLSAEDWQEVLGC